MDWESGKTLMGMYAKELEQCNGDDERERT